MTMRGPHQHLCHIFLLLITFWELCWCFAAAYAVCPITLPCHCLTDAVYCAFKRLEGLPYFLQFDHPWKELDLSENLLSSLPPNGFEKVRVLDLILQRNAISEIHPFAFRGLRNVSMLDLSHNHIKHLSSRVFEPLKELRCLKLTHNQMNVVNSEAFKGIPQLEELDLTGNDLQRVPVTALQPLTGLKRLKLRNNRLDVIDSFAFDSLPLEYLDLGSNGGNLDIKDGAFCGLDPRIKASEPQVIEWTGLTTLYLDHNGLTTVSPCVTKMLWTLSLVDISGNPLQCSCQLVLLRDQGLDTEFPGAQCAGPKRYAGKYLSELDTKNRCNDTSRTFCNGVCRGVRPAPSISQTSAAPPHTASVKTILLTWMAIHTLVHSLALVTKHFICVMR